MNYNDQYPYRSAGARRQPSYGGGQRQYGPGYDRQAYNAAVNAPDPDDGFDDLTDDWADNSSSYNDKNSGSASYAPRRPQPEREQPDRAQPGKEYQAKQLAPLLIYAALAVAVLLSVLFLNSYSVPITRSDASMGLMDKFIVRSDSISNRSFSNVEGFKPSYSIPESTVVCPKPDPGSFGSSPDDSVIDSVISASDLARGTQLVWHDGIQYHPETTPVYYSDPSIFALAWKENNGVNIINFCEIIIADGSQFRRFLCDNTFGSNNQKYATTMAESLNAVVAMNGDFYAHRQAGVTVYQGKVYRNNPQFLDQCFIDSGGNMIFTREGEIGNDEQFQKFVDDNDISFSLSFGPILVEDHKAISSIGRYSLGEVKETYARTAIGMVEEKHYLFCLVEGAKGGFIGIDILGLAAIMEQRGCEKAYTLDGGQTAELIFNNELYSRVVYEAERQVSDIIFFATAVNY